MKILFLFYFRVQNGPSFGKAIASSIEFCAHIGAYENRITFVDLRTRKGKMIYASDAVVTDMSFLPTASDTLATASRDKTVSITALFVFKLESFL